MIIVPKVPYRRTDGLHSHTPVGGTTLILALVMLLPPTGARAQEEGTNVDEASPPERAEEQESQPEEAQPTTSTETSEDRSEPSPEETIGRPATAEPGAAATPADIEEITVTGSRIRRTGIATPTPTTVLDDRLLLETGKVNVADVLNELPAIATGLSNQNTSYSFGNAGLNQVNLRALGVRRTLTLVNGRRPIGTPNDENFLAFDLSNMPPNLIERIEVITGGTSAVYGADAVAGVINIITKKNFEGTQLDLQAGTSQFIDASQYNVNALTGANFAEDRGNFILALNYAHFDRLWRTDRDYDVSGLFYVSNPENGGPEDGVPDLIARSGLRYAFFGNPRGVLRLPVDENLQRLPDTVSDDELRLLTFDDDGNLRLYDVGSGIIDGSYTDGSDGSIPGGYKHNKLPPLTRFNVYGRGSYAISGSVRAVLEGVVARTHSNDIIDPGFAVYGSNNFLSLDNPYIQDDLRRIMLGDPVDPTDDIEQISLDRQHREYGPRETDITRDFASISAGLEGMLPNGWDWQVYFQTGGTVTTNTTFNDQLDARFAQALDAVRDPTTGEIVCRDEAARAQGCVPVNILGPTGTISDEAAAWITTDHTSLTNTQQQLLTAFVRGNLLDLPAGSLAFAAGAEYRREGLRTRPSYVFEQALGFYASQFSAVDESFDVKEAFAELSVPLVNDVFLLNQVGVEAAARIASYELSGENLSWKVGGDWSPVTDVRLRAVYAKAARAPGLGELFDPGSRGAVGLDDPCDALFINDNPNRAANCAALGIPPNFISRTRNLTTLVFSTGNRNLEVEDGYTLTLGGVVTPRFVPGLSITADYWNIKLTNGINRFGAQTTLENCVDFPTIDNEFCKMITRGDDFNILEVKDTFVNVSEFRVNGIDLEANYNLDLGSAGIFNFRLIGTHLRQLDFAEAPQKGGDVDEDAGEVGNPKWRGSFGATYSRGPASVNVQLRYVGPQDWDAQESPERRDPFVVPAAWYSDLQARYAFEETPLGKRFEIYAGVNNVFDKEPPYHPDVYRGTLSLYDPIGRFFYGGISTRL